MYRYYFKKHNCLSKPSALFTPSKDSGCTPLLVNFTNTSDPKNGESINSMSFIWKFGSSIIDTFKNQIRTFTNSGTNDSITFIQLIATSKWGCRDTIKDTVTVFPLPKADFFSTNYSSCAPSIINNSNVSLTQYPNANNTYKWEILNKNGTIKSTSIGIIIPIDTIKNPNDTLFYRLIVTNIHGCKPDTLQRMFVTIDNPIASFNRSDTAGCTTLPVLFTNTSTVGASAVWDFGNNQTSALFSPPSINFVNPSNISDSIYKVKLVVTAGSGCKDSITKDIRVFPKPKAIFNITNPICAIDTASAFNNSIFKGGITTYRWKFIQNTSSTINDTASFSPLFTFTNNQSSVDSTYNIRLWVTVLMVVSMIQFDLSLY
ncbi:MAG: PKD domain-containing protein [Bacteroidetes bacterium]|nr:PKD domain-containing protein [Bacteroidota bacterium]